MRISHRTIAKSLSALALTSGLLFTALPAAAVTLPPLVPECARNQTTAPSLNCALQAFANVANIILGLTGSFALLMFVYGGFLMLSSAGEAEKVTEGKAVLRNAVFGILIIMMSGTVIRYGMSQLKITTLTVGSKCGTNSVVVSLPGGELKCVTGCTDEINKGITTSRYRCMNASQGTSCIPGLCPGDTGQQCCRPQ
jgi:hypothetical protein